MDYYSDSFEVDRIYDKKSTEVISKLRSQFARHGIPVQLFSDNWPPFNSKEFQEFALAYEFEHLTSSPRFPKCKGKVENAVNNCPKTSCKRDVIQEPTQICHFWITVTLQLKEFEVLLHNVSLDGGLGHCCQHLQGYLFLRQSTVPHTSVR